ncbi:hypothetical protein quinque_001673 [Culex quinquefasciatus]|uniref:putative metabolite transport protein HI_1104 n=1 Tax=Culex quinquefasciatus TaxID=7176 RepID=UPI0018E32265|nr:putative metabolite transport protein HI_1104 [Culex quinquefasciatus]XP_038118826.1 putative metabolite transport protein HI_1104 [Culex quinquefasciatus]
MQTLADKLRFLYKPYVLAVLTIGYIAGELGHYLIGVTSKATAIELDYGDHACQQNHTEVERHLLSKQCADVILEHECHQQLHNGTLYCEWNYNGLGLEYQLLAGPSFIAVFTVMGVVLGFAADRFNRVRMLTVCTLVFGLAIIFQGTVQEYWQLILLRMVMAAGEAGCNPLATGIMSDIFPESKRALVMAIFNWGIYGGYGIAFPVGRYITKLDIWGQGWRICYYGTGVLALLMAVLTGTTLKEPERQSIGEENEAKVKVPLVKVLMQPRVILLMIAASIRHCGGMTFAYNADLYYNIYFPDVDLGWWLFAVTIGIGSIGVVIGGIVSDKFVAKMGIRSRVACLAISQLIATPFAFGSVYYEPLWAMITLGISYFFAEMWFGIVFAVLVEIVPLQVRSTTIGVFLFVMNNIGGNLPILVDPLAKAIGYRGSVMFFYAGFYGLSTILFFITMFFMDGPVKATAPETTERNQVEMGHENNTFQPDDFINGINGGAPKTNGHNILNVRPSESSRL